jgi:hypothetical protein
LLRKHDLRSIAAHASAERSAARGRGLVRSYLLREHDLRSIAALANLYPTGRFLIPPGLAERSAARLLLG